MLWNSIWEFNMSVEITDGAGKEGNVRETRLNKIKETADDW